MARLDKLPAKGKVYRFRKMLFWAQGGCICMERTDVDGDFNVISRAKFAAEVIMMRDAVNKGCYDQYADERIEMTNFVVNGAAAVKEGKKQGDPFDPAVMAQQLRDRHISKGFIYLGDGSKHTISTTVSDSPLANPPARIVSPGPGQRVPVKVHTKREVPERVSDLPRLGGDR